MNRAIWRIPEYVAGPVFGLVVLISIGFLILGVGGRQEAHLALSGAISLWSEPPWSALASVWSEFGSAVRTSAASNDFDPSIVIYAWTLALYAIPYFALFISGMVLQISFAKRQVGSLLQRLFGVISWVSLTIFDVCLLTFVASWISGFVTSLISAASNTGA